MVETQRAIRPCEKQRTFWTFRAIHCVWWFPVGRSRRLRPDSIGHTAGTSFTQQRTKLVAECCASSHLDDSYNLVVVCPPSVRLGVSGEDDRGCAKRSSWQEDPCQVQVRHLLRSISFKHSCSAAISEFVRRSLLVSGQSRVMQLCLGPAKHWAYKDLQRPDYAVRMTQLGT
jgi:hypothetical protein